MFQLVNSSINEVSARPLDLAGFVEQLSGLLPRFCQAMIRHEANLLASGKLNLPQVWALEALAEQPRSMHELARRLRLKSSTNTLFVDRLELLGAVRRARDPADRRAVRVELTARGRRVIEQLRAQKRAGLTRLFRPLTAAERRQYLSLIEKLVWELDREAAATAARPPRSKR